MTAHEALAWIIFPAALALAVWVIVPGLATALRYVLAPMREPVRALFPGEDA